MNEGITKPEAEQKLRHLISRWVREESIDVAHPAMPSFSDFKQWLEGHGYGHYLGFRSRRGPLIDAEQWFDEELKQAWRN